MKQYPAVQEVRQLSTALALWPKLQYNIHNFLGDLPEKPS